MKGVVILMVSIIHENVYCEPCFKYAQEVIPPDPTGKSMINFRLFELITNIKSIFSNIFCLSIHTKFRCNKRIQIC